MNTRIPFKGRMLGAMLALGALAFTACNSDSGNNPSSDDRAAISGRVQGDDASSSGSGWESTVITTHTINADGSLSAARDSGNANGDGTFVLETALKGEQDLVLRARRDTTTWMARFNGDLKVGETSKVRPLNLQSTLETAVWLELQKTSEGRDVHSSEVSVAIDAEASAKARNDYRGSQSARNELVSRLAAAVKAGSEARRAFLVKADSLYNARRDAILDARAEAEAELHAALVAAANDTTAIRNARRAFVNAYVMAYVNADIQRTNLARASEAAYQASVRASAQLADSSRTALTRAYAKVLAVACDTAMRDEFKDAGASQARLQLVADAGVRLRASIDSAWTRARIDSAVARFRADVKAAYDDTADTTFNVWTAILSQVNVTTFLNSLAAGIATAIGASVDGAVVGDAHGKAHADARADLVTRFSAGENDAAKARAAANVGAFLWVHSANN